MSQENQNKKPNNSFWKSKATKWGIALLIILLIVVVLLIVYFLNRDTTKSIDVNEFNKIIKSSAVSVNDNAYISSFLDDNLHNRFKVAYSIDQNGKELLRQAYVYLTPQQKELWYAANYANASQDSLLVQAMAFTKDGAIQYGNIEAVKITDPSFFSNILRFLPMLLYILFFAVFIWIMFRQSQGAGLPGGQGKSQAIRINSKTKFSDIAGNEEAKEEVMELVDFLKNPKKYTAAGARIPKGILLGGPPGTGKTLLAKATAGEANVPFFFISASSFVELFVGMGAKRVREMFREARKYAPAIIFIDELDAVGRSRGAGIGGGNDEREQTLNQLLVEMDGITENSGILIMAATNRTDVLDPALLRPGRFDRTVTVGLPDVKEREAILKLHARGKRVDKAVSFAKVAKRTPGFSGAQLENVINEASLLSVRENTKVITLDQIDEAIDRVMSGPAKKSRTISKAENTAVAYHEAGHAVVGLKIKGGNKVQKITIIPRGNAGGYNLMMPEEEKYNMSKNDLIAMITSFMGGRAAERIVYGDENVSTGASDDISKATQIARRMVTEWGMSDLGPIKYEEDSSNPFLGRDYTKAPAFGAKVAQDIDSSIRKIIIDAEQRAQKIIEDNRELLELIKEALIIKETIVAEEIEYIEKHMKLPEEVVEDKKHYSEESDTELSFDELLTKAKEEETEVKEKTEEKQDDEAPAVVGQLSVSNESLDFSSLATKTTKRNKREISEEQKNLTPRERAILERRKKAQDKENEDK
ncbi:ATP-dependent zinc metalloprotease FtsH [[Mycoplasma] gypis]|uniref:ATP-dependent zinc metalloprotease FtsH n=1 Tax=[Mycoplasma] gypis TaxID=92404 RepID=A0ABZ2RMT1_9BACT|nr:ATP-dependent zinc metalloprotease FtsH [[Mycoplasma] gypis]MBN0919527.1 ATP-dependent zinc metalloprotease FtsH [[Mycoplasma] gypis]